ncbi:MAG: hypothetical protein KAS32_19335 [Candidatus Peribacteraceae bacterium]|nr:hypothetical protein [Candidatus Peribacteraceae bacterium]
MSEEYFERLCKANEEIGGLKSELDFLHKGFQEIRNCCIKERKEYEIINELEGSFALDEFQAIIERIMKRLKIEFV